MTDNEKKSFAAMMEEKFPSRPSYVPRPFKARGPQKVKRPSVLDHTLLSDGRNAWAVAKAMGMHEATFRHRLHHMHPDDVVMLEVVKPADRFRGKMRAATHEELVDEAARRGKQAPRDPNGLPPYYERLMEDGRKAWHVAKANGVDKSTFCNRLSREWSPDRAATEPVVRRSSPTRG